MCIRGSPRGVGGGVCTNSVEDILGVRAHAHSIYTKFVEIILEARLSSISHSFDYGSLRQKTFF